MQQHSIGNQQQGSVLTTKTKVNNGGQGTDMGLHNVKTRCHTIQGRQASEDDSAADLGILMDEIAEIVKKVRMA